MFNKSLATAAAVSTLALMATTAHATTTAYTNASTFQAAGAAGIGGTQVADQVNWAVFASAVGTSANNGTINYGSMMTTALGETITVTNSTSPSKLPFTTYTEGLGGWDGNFVAGTTVLYNGPNQTTTLTFASLLSGVGVDMQTFKTGAYSYTLTAYDSGGNALGTAIDSGTTFTNPSTGNNTSKEGTVTFAGLTSTAVNISYVTITTTNDGSGFAIDTSLIYHSNIQGGGSGPATTPEPGTLALLGMGLLGLGWVRRRKTS